jgi:hypothetical protein
MEAKTARPVVWGSTNGLEAEQRIGDGTLQLALEGFYVTFLLTNMFGRTLKLEQGMKVFDVQ